MPNDIAGGSAAHCRALPPVRRRHCRRKQDWHSPPAPTCPSQAIAATAPAAEAAVASPPAAAELAAVDAALERLSARKSAWAAAPLDERIALLKEIRSRLLDQLTPWCRTTAGVRCSAGNSQDVAADVLLTGGWATPRRAACAWAAIHEHAAAPATICPAPPRPLGPPPHLVRSAHHHQRN